MSMKIRRASPTDADSINKLKIESLVSVNNPDTTNKTNEEILEARYGDNLDIESDVSSLSFVGIIDEKIVGFSCFSSAPPIPRKEYQSYLENDDVEYITWLHKQWDIANVNYNNTTYLTFFLSDSLNSLEFMDISLKTTFRLLPQLKRILFILKSETRLFEPLSSTKIYSNSTVPVAVDATAVEQSDVPESNPLLSFNQFRANMINKRSQKTQDPTYFKIVNTLDPIAICLYECLRSNILPPFRVRTARVEDTDDLIPMLRRQRLLEESHGDFYLAELLESKNPCTKTLIAEVDGQVMAFMSVVSEFNLKALADLFDLTLFDNLVKDPLNYADVVDDGEPKKHKVESIEANSICIRMFIIEDLYSNHILDVIKYAFTLFPEKDYCAITMPTTSPSLSNFPVVHTKIGNIENHCLYLFNRFTLSGPLAVRRADLEKDTAGVMELISGIDFEKNIAEDFAKSPNIHNNDELVVAKYATFLATQQEQIVGLVILKNFYNPSSFIAQFEIETFVNVKYHDFEKKPSNIAHIVINPLFEDQSRWFLEEIMRLSENDTLFYLANNPTVNGASTSKISKAELVPVKRRRQIQFPKNIKDGTVIKNPHEHSLQLITASILYEPKIVINAKILVIGGSDVGLSFLEKLVYTPHLRFTSLTLVSSNPITVSENPLFVDSKCFTPNEISQIGLDYYVNCIKGSTKDIDRINKIVKLHSGLHLPYDYLILVPGLQFTASAISEEFSKLVGVYGVNRPSADKLQKDIEVFATNANIRMREEETEGSDVNNPKCVVYGRHIQAYSAIEALLKKGVHPWDIYFVAPKITYGTAFNNAVVDDLVEKTMKECGVTIYRDYKLTTWESNDGILTSVTIISQKKGPAFEKKLINVDLFIYADLRTVDYSTFLSINDSCLVFDGLLVIDKYFRTHDPFIFASGSVAKYASRYKTLWSPNYYDSRELGEKMAETLLPLFDPTMPPKALDDSSTLLEFKQPKKIEAHLPGNLYYFHFDQPRLPSETLELRQKQSAYGRDCIMSKSDKKEYFRINVDTFGYIRSVTYIGDRAIPTDNFMCLNGLHEQYLNRFVARYDEEGAGIDDFISFLQEDWALPLYHDRFPQFIKKLTSQMMSSGDEEFQDLINKMKELAPKGREIPVNQRNILYDYFDRLQKRKEWDRDIYDFLVECDVHTQRAFL